MSLVPATGGPTWGSRIVLEENRHQWMVLIHNPDGREYALGHWAGIDITEGFEGPHTTIEVNSLEPALVYITELETDLLFFRRDITDRGIPGYWTTPVPPVPGWLTGASGSASTPDQAAYNMGAGTDFNITALVRPGAAGWTGADRTIAAQRGTSSDCAWRLSIDSSGRLWFDWSPTGSTSFRGHNPVNLSAWEEVDTYIGITFDRAANTAVQAITSTDGVTWTPVGTTATNPDLTAIFNSTRPIEIGGYANTARWQGRIYWAEMRLGLTPGAGTRLWRFDASDYVSGTTWTDPRGTAWTVTAAGAMTPMVPAVPSVWVPPVPPPNLLLYRMRVIDSEDVFSRDGHIVRYECSSYEKLLERRLVMEDWVLVDEDLDAAWKLVDYAQDQEDLGITRDPAAVGGTTRQRTLAAGDTIFEAINDFAEADDGFDWWIDQFLVWHAQKPRRGEIYGDEWQWGAEVAEAERQAPLEDYASVVMTTGAQNETRIPDGSGGETVYPPPPPQIVQLPVKNVGYWAKSISYSDVITVASLLDKATFNLNDLANMRPTYKITLEPGIWNPNFRLGDVIYLRIASPPRLDIRVPVRIEELHITCSTDGAEVVEVSVRAEESESLINPNPGFVPNGRTIPRRRLHAWDDVAALFNDLDKRTGRLERVTNAVPEPPATAWTVLSPLGTGWTARPGAAGTAYLSYRKIGDVVYLRGMLDRVGATAALVIATLPAGFRPPNVTMPFPVAYSGGLASAPVTAPHVLIRNTGVIEQVNMPTSTDGYVGLNGISFSVTP